MLSTGPASMARAARPASTTPHLRLRQRGFSLLELLIVVAAMAVIMAISLPVFPGMIDSYRMSGAATVVSAKLNEARMNAIKRSRPSWLQVDFDGTSLQVQSTLPGGEVIDVGRPGLVSSDVSLVKPVITITFDSTGCPIDPPPQVLVLESTVHGTRRTVRVSPAGNVTVE